MKRMLQNLTRTTSAQAQRALMLTVKPSVIFRFTFSSGCVICCSSRRLVFKAPTLDVAYWCGAAGQVQDPTLAAVDI